MKPTIHIDLNLLFYFLFDKSNIDSLNRGKISEKNIYFLMGLYQFLFTVEGKVFLIF